MRERLRHTSLFVVLKGGLMKIVNVLGTEYKIEVRKQCDDIELMESDGYCSDIDHLIVIVDMDSNDNYKMVSKEGKLFREKQVIRHELIHAFLFESGLAFSSLSCDTSWAINEEMVDWMARMSPKMIEAFKEAGAL